MRKLGDQALRGMQGLEGAGNTGALSAGVSPATRAVSKGAALRTEEMINVEVWHHGVINVSGGPWSMGGKEGEKPTLEGNIYAYVAWRGCPRALLECISIVMPFYLTSKESHACRVHPMSPEG